MTRGLLKQIAELSKQDRLALAYETLDSALRDSRAPAFSESQWNELKRRLDEYSRQPDAAGIAFGATRRRLEQS